jgi:hypothetical protein
MNEQLSKRWAKINVAIIAVFYLISGVWEILVGETQGTGFSGGPYYLVEVHKDYLIILGRITFFVGIGLLFRINLIRLAALILAWWNLFTAPLVDIWWDIYAGHIKKFLTLDSSFTSIIYVLELILVMTAIRLYIIYMLRIPKAGYIFLRKKKDETVD